MTEAKDLIQEEQELENKLKEYKEGTPEYLNVCNNLDDVRSKLLELGF